MPGARALRLPFAALAVLSTLALPPRSEPAAAAPSGGDAVAACQANVGPTPQIGQRVCRVVQSFTEGLAAGCRNLSRDVGLEPDLRPVCETIDGRVINPSEVDAYEASWTHRALGLQRALDDGVPFTRSLLPHTHNSFNASTYFPTLTNQDPNQIYSVTDQLRMDIRAIEFDVHWVPSIYGDASTGGKALTLCHGDTGYAPPVHVGCTNDRPFAQGLDELAAWLHAPGNGEQFVLLYLENAMDGDVQAHNLAAAEIAARLGPLVARPPTGQPCAAVPTTTSRAALRAAGHRVLIVGNCGPGDWGGWVHERAVGSRWFESSSGAGDDYPGLATGCAAERSRTHADTRITRWYNDATLVSVQVDSQPQGEVTTSEAAAMVGCGVNLVGFDKIAPDARLTALVWSWAEGAPSPPSLGPMPTPRCAYVASEGRFHDGGCGALRRVSCSTGPAAWAVTATKAAWADGPAACAAEYPGSRFAVPANGWENAQLRSVIQGDTWVSYSDQSGTGAWTVS